ncbi:hypothetical protein M404DRAFT_34605 [Pisolithus tinctorius Marx 270]|uniref:Uncharacterized protein n=1 Tax=Pisolithus tinctorius Marx 270 TaxID=870435 RepID=A0A0C3JB76_PISTI|nr:hypothetical protein M404DRAFT_34605 [Pisolithus tinctorius Marx 270]
MDSGVRRLYVDLAGVSDCRALSYECIRREYAFECVALQHELSLQSNVMSLVCCAGSLREFVEHYPFLGMKDIRSIATFHKVVLHRKLRRMMCLDALRIHECTAACPALVYVFRELRTARRGCSLVPVLPPAVAPEVNIAHVRGLHRLEMQAVRPTPTVGTSQESPSYPPFRSLSDKFDIIRDWQNNISPQHLREDVCAVCAQLVPCRDLADVAPTEEMLFALRNDWLPQQCCPRTYDIEKYHGAILCYRGMHCLHDIGQLRMCPSCRKALTMRSPRQPKDAIANFQYFSEAELPHCVRQCMQACSALELMLVAACRATVITHHYQTRSGRGGRVPEEASQRFNRGNVALLPQDPCSLTNVLPPMQNDLQGAVCIVFAGGSFRPSLDTLRKFPPVLVSRSRVKCVIEWLISNNEWYSKSGITFSAENLAALIEGEEDEGVLQGIEITHLRNDDDTVDGSDHIDWTALTADLVMETVAYIDGDRSERSCRSMKATALAHVLNHKSFLWCFCIWIHGELVGLITLHGDPTSRSPSSDNSEICFGSLVDDIQEAELDIRALAEKLEHNPKARLNAGGERRALRLFHELNVICRSLPGSDGYKLGRCNEIRSLTQALGSPAFFLTLNPHDLTNVLVAHFGGMDTARWHELGAFEHATFVASHPAAATKAFDVLIRGFLDIIVKYNKSGGLFGNCTGYYGMVEAQGRGTLHCHMLLWIEGHPNPECLRSIMTGDQRFEHSLFQWLEDVIHCEPPGSSVDCLNTVDIKSPKPARLEDELDPCLEEPPQIAMLPECDFEDAFNDFVRRLAIECNWHEHTPTCFKHLCSGEEP